MTEWGWMKVGSDTAHGPFSTPEDARWNANEYCDEGDEVQLGHCRWASAPSYLPDLGDLMQSMEETAYNNDFPFWDDEIFDVADPKKANEELASLFRSWAEKWLAPRVWVLEDVGESYPFRRVSNKLAQREEKP